MIKTSPRKILCYCIFLLPLITCQVSVAESPTLPGPTLPGPIQPGAKEAASIINYLLLDESEPNDHIFIRAPLGLGSLTQQIPLDNKLTKPKVELGKILFFDKRLSFNDTQSCASCHKPDKAFADDVALSPGANGVLSKRNAPSLLNLVFRGRGRRAAFQDISFFWDGRTPTLEEQAVLPIINPDELGMPSFEALITKLDQIQGYKPLFEEAFGSPEITIDRIGKAIASFERTLVSGNSPLDRYTLLDDTQAISESAKRGLALFKNGQCHFCHIPQRANDDPDDPTIDEPGLMADLGNEFDSIGVGRDLANPDEGAGNGLFRVPTLRDLSLTAPYMHDGSLATLEEVLLFYANIDIEEFLDQPILHSVGLAVDSEDKRIDVLNFLKSLNGVVPNIEAPTAFPQ